jgi:hypothetical protein
MSQDEHKPPTDEELAGGLLNFDRLMCLSGDAMVGANGEDEDLEYVYADVAISRIKRLIAEVRRLRTDRDRAKQRVQEWVSEKLKRLVDAEIIAPLQLELEPVRTLTLPNGTDVRVGEFYVDHVAPSEARYVECIGEEIICYFVWEFLRGQWYRTELETLPHAMLENSNDWRPWSEVYPDRPVPGEPNSTTVTITGLRVECRQCGAIDSADGPCAACGADRPVPGCGQ